MAATATVYDLCPECGVAVPIAVSFPSLAVEGDALIVAGEPDLTDVIVHSWTHDDQGP